MEKYLPIISYWLPPIPCNLYRLGHFLGLTAQFLQGVSQQKGDILFDKFNKVLLAGYNTHGDDFPGRLRAVLKSMELECSFQRLCQTNHMQNPFLSHPPTVYYNDLEETVLSLAVELAYLVEGEPGVDILAAITFANRSSEPTLAKERNMAMKVFKTMLMGYNRLELQDFVKRLQTFVKDLGASRVYNKVLQETLSVAPEYEDIFKWVE